MRELLIKRNDSGQRLNKYLLKYLNEAPSSFIYKMLRKKNIILNDAKANGDEILIEGDIVKLYLAEETIMKFQSSNIISDNSNSSLHWQDLKILYQDSDVLAVHKPTNLLSQKANAKDISINEIIFDYCVNKQILSKEDLKTFHPSVCNRLDRNTTGIILAGISLKGSQMLSSVLKNREGEKYYFTIVKNDMKRRMHEIAYIKKEKKDNLSEVISEEEYKKLSCTKKDFTKLYDRIETEFIPLNNKNGFTFLKIKLITGKSHQIRAHLKMLGYPIIGDPKYGDFSTNQYMREKYKLKNQLLHAGIFIFPDGRIIKDELPEQFQNICKGFGFETNI